MPTNASKYLVCFSDLAWDSVNVHQDKPPGQNIATFPEAHEVGKYLQAYADKYIPSDTIQFGREVVRIARSDEVGSEWKVTTRPAPATETGHAVTHHFDHVIVASGFFATPVIPPLPGLAHFQGPVVHSSRLRDPDSLLQQMNGRSNVAVIGGSMSGAEAAATLAFRISTLRHGLQKHSTIDADRLTVYQITPRPFWSLPPHIPVDPCVNDAVNPRPTFRPLDVVLADLSHRPGAQIRFAPSSTFAPDAAKKFHAVLHSFVGSDQSDLGGGALAIKDSKLERPPWLSISTTHAEFVRAGDINVICGRAAEIQDSTITIKKDDGETVELSDIGLVVMATGFSPHPALSFLSREIREALGYDVNNRYDPIQLFNWGTMNPCLPSLGFVGFYRGPYFGVLEQQARFLGALWSGSLREIPQERPGSVQDMEQRGQFPMGDYVGLMESMSAILDHERMPLSPHHPPREGPAVPARYGGGKMAGTNSSAAGERRIACEGVVEMLAQPSLFVGAAVFRALQGRWKLSRKIKSAVPSYPSGTFTGVVNLYPREPTADGYAAEMLYTEEGELATDQGVRMTGRRRYVYRLSKFAPQAITAWFVKADSGSEEVDGLFHDVCFRDQSHAVVVERDGWGSGWRATGSHHLCVEDHYDTDYWFQFQAIEVREWGIGYTVKGPNKDYWTRASYSR